MGVVDGWLIRARDAFRSCRRTSMLGRSEWVGGVPSGAANSGFSSAGRLKTEGRSEVLLGCFEPFAPKRANPAETFSTTGDLDSGANCVRNVLPHRRQITAGSAATAPQRGQILLWRSLKNDPLLGRGCDPELFPSQLENPITLYYTSNPGGFKPEDYLARVVPLCTGDTLGR